MELDEICKYLGTEGDGIDKSQMDKLVKQYYQR